MGQVKLFFGSLLNQERFLATLSKLEKTEREIQLLFPATSTRVVSILVGQDFSVLPSAMEGERFRSRLSKCSRVTPVLFVGLRRRDETVVQSKQDTRPTENLSGSAKLCLEGRFWLGRLLPGTLEDTSPTTEGKKPFQSTTFFAILERV